MPGVALAVAGASGRVGQMITRAALDTPGVRLCAALVSPGSRHAGQPLPQAADLRYTCDVAQALAGAQVLIDFSLPQATAGLLAAASQRGVAVVLGTTGLSADDEAAIDAAARRVALVRSANMSLGVNLLLGLIAQASRALPDFDIEIVETHHRHKRDAPSGTALMMADAAARARGLSPGEALCSGRSGETGSRKGGEIGVSAVRGGDVIGDHTVLLLGNGERIELGHQATSREVFGRGAVRAALWVAGRPPGRYDMQDVLGLRP